MNIDVLMCKSYYLPVQFDFEKTGGSHLPFRLKCFNTKTITEGGKDDRRTQDSKKQVNIATIS